MGKRVLVTSPASLGHVQPMLPLVKALVARGNDVLWALPPAGVAHVERAGIRALAAGNPEPAGPATALVRYPELADISPAERPDVMFGKIFGAMAAPDMLADLVKVPREWRPELVVCDAGEFAGHVLAAELGVPSVTKGFGPLLPERRVASAADEVAPLWQSRGLSPRPFGGAYDHLYLDSYPPELQREAAAHVPRRQLLRHVADDSAGETVDQLPLPAGRAGAPLVYVTMGTVFNDPAPLRLVLDAVTDLDVRVLATVGPHGDPAMLGTYPPHVRVERYVPQTALLPHTDLVVSHAGSGTTLGALIAGRPHLCLPQGADQFLNAAAIASAGAGMQLPPHDADARRITEAVARLLEEPGFAATARKIGDSIAAMPSPEDVAGVLEALA